MTFEKVSISLESALLEQARELAGRRGLSGLVNDALRIKLQHERLRRLLEQMDREFGPVPDEALKQARKQWPARRNRSRHVA